MICWQITLEHLRWMMMTTIRLIHGPVKSYTFCANLSNYFPIDTPEGGSSPTSNSHHLGVHARGPLRAGRDEARGSRWFSAGERDDALADAALFVVLGIVLLVLGVLTDTRYPLF